MIFRQLKFTIIIDSRSIISIFQDTRRMLPMSRCFTSVLKFGFFFVLLITELWGNFNLRLRTFMLQDIFPLVQFPKNLNTEECKIPPQKWKWSKIRSSNFNFHFNIFTLYISIHKNSNNHLPSSYFINLNQMRRLPVWCDRRIPRQPWNWYYVKQGGAQS